MGWKSYIRPAVPDIPEWVRRVAKDDKWTISQERVFIEDLVYKRMTLFLAIVAAVLAGVINLKDQLGLSILLLGLGTALCWVFQQTIYRAQIKLDIILSILFADNSHPAGYVNTVLSDESRVKWVGYLVPKVICTLLTGLTAIQIAVYFLKMFRPELFGAVMKWAAAGGA